MRFIGNFFIFFIGVYSLPADLFWTCGHVQEYLQLQYKLPNIKLWAQNSRSLIAGTDYYQFSKDKSISLKSMVLTSNLYKTSYAKNGKEIAEKIFSIKKNLFRVLGARKYKINSYKMISHGKFSELNLSFQFYLKSKMSYSHEKYFIHPEQTMMMDLSWSSDSQETQLQFARNEFANILVFRAK